MKNTDLTQHSDNELVLWVENDEFLYQAWNRTIRRGDMSYVKDTLDECGFKYTNAQWETLVTEFEEELQAEEDRQEAAAKEANEFFVALSNKAN